MTNQRPQPGDELAKGTEVILKRSPNTFGFNLQKRGIVIKSDKIDTPNGNSFRYTIEAKTISGETKNVSNLVAFLEFEPVWYPEQKRSWD